jgi:hypothetical protein
VSTYRVPRELAEALKAEVPSIEDLEEVVEKLRSELVEVREAQQRSEEESWAGRNQTSVLGDGPVGYFSEVSKTRLNARPGLMDYPKLPAHRALPEFSVLCAK